MPDIIVKPRFDNGGGGFVFEQPGTYEVYDADGNKIDAGQTTGRPGHHGFKVQSRPIAMGQGAYFVFNGQRYNLTNPGKRHEFVFGKENPSLVSNKGAVGGGRGGGSYGGQYAGGRPDTDGIPDEPGYGGGGYGGARPDTDGIPDEPGYGGGEFPFGDVYGGGSVGGSALPFYLGDFPQFNPVNFNPINFREMEAAPFNFTDPIEYSKKFGDFNRDQFSKNFKQGQEFALDALNTELQGLKNFVPAAAALKREQISVDNQFNQAQRTNQVDTTLPSARGTFDRLEGTLRGQGQRAQTYAQGRLTDPQVDRAFELGIRSNAADAAGFGGFGSKSMQAEKVSDLMSAEQRFGISQYGESLIDQNTARQVDLQNNRANLYLAPTQYSDAGAQVRVTPEVGAGRLTYQGANALNEATMISPGQALTSNIQQEQYRTNLEQNTRQFNTEGVFRADSFNSQNQLQADMFNSQGQFTADLGLFQYQTGYLAQLQGANQNNLNLALGAGVAGMNQGQYNSGFGAGQNANTWNSIAEGLGSMYGAYTNSNTGTGDAGSNTYQGSDATDGVGESQDIDTSPSETNEDTTSSQPVQQAQRTTTATSTAPATQPRMAGVDMSIPNSYRFAPGSTVPPGYAPVINNADGSVTAVKSSDYAAEAERFAKFAGVQGASNVSIQGMALADRALANSAGLSFIPTRGFRPMALTPSGRQVYSSEAMATDGNVAAGQQQVSSTQQFLAQMGVTDEGTMRELTNLSEKVSSPEVMNGLDRISQEEGQEGVAKAILNQLGVSGGSKTKENAQVTAGALRLGQLWNNLSPAQKSMGLASLAQPIVKDKTGKAIGDHVVRGSENSVAGPLKVSDVAKITDKGINGYAVARNYRDSAAIAKIVAGAKTPEQVAMINQQIGAVGFGNHGGSVPVKATYLKEVGAEPAPEFGVGASVFSDVKQIPNGYQAVTQTPDGKVVALPKTHAKTSAFSQNSINPLVYKKSQAIAQGSHPAQKTWSKVSPSDGVIRGSVGGSAMIASLDNMAKTTPTVFSAVAAHSLFANTMGK